MDCGGFGVVTTRAVDFAAADFGVVPAVGGAAGGACVADCALCGICGGVSFGSKVPSERTDTVLTFLGSIRAPIP